MKKYQTFYFAIIVVFCLNPFLYADDKLDASSSNLFDECKFSIDSTVNLKIDNSVGAWKKDDTYKSFCSINIEGQGIWKFDKSGSHGEYATLGSGPGLTTSLTISDKRHPASEVMGYAGFTNSKNNEWKFNGSPFTICDKGSYYSNLSIRENKKNDDDYTLIGRQTEHGCNQTGAPITFEGAYIERETSDFYVSISIAYEIGVSKQTANAITSELTKVVESVRVTNAPSN